MRACTYFRFSFPLHFQEFWNFSINCSISVIEWIQVLNVFSFKNKIKCIQLLLYNSYTITFRGIQLCRFYTTASVMEWQTKNCLTADLKLLISIHYIRLILKWPNPIAPPPPPWNISKCLKLKFSESAVVFRVMRYCVFWTFLFIFQFNWQIFFRRFVIVVAIVRFEYQFPDPRLHRYTTGKSIVVLWMSHILYNTDNFLW